jgi:hypothetical protein
MEIRTLLVVLSVLFTLSGVIPYIIQVIRGNTKPRIASWLTWSVLTAIACAASLVEKQYPTAILLFFASLETLSVVILGWKYGDKKFERLDIVCLTGAAVGLILWHLFNSPAIAVIATISIDILGGIPSLVHSWRKPYEETWITFLVSALGSLCTLLALTDWRVTSFAYPLYLVCINTVFSSVIILRQRVKRPKTTISV